MRTILLEDMRGIVRERANNQRSSDATINRSINTYLADLWDKLVQARGEQYYKAPVPLPLATVVGTDAYQLSAIMLGVSLYKVLGVWWVVAANDYIEILPYDMNRARGRARSYGWNQHNGRLYYAIEQDYIRFQPTPTSVCNVVIDYIHAFVDLADGDSFDGVNGWEDYAIYRAAADLARDESDFELSDRLEGKAAELSLRIEKMAASRDLLNPPRMLQRRGRDMRADSRWDEEDGY